jgi:POT family proton-dependent oligopeptide transporter
MAQTKEPGEFLGHPKALFVLFFTEMWERFSFYSMRAFLVLYMTKALLITQQTSNEIYGAYLGFVYAAPFLGGMLADRLLGQRRSIVIGGILMAAAQFSLAIHAYQIHAGISSSSLAMNCLFFLGLGLLSAGNGFFKPNISSIVGSLYTQGDARRDGAFTIFYMGINIGAFLAGFSGQLAENFGWYWGFFIAGVGMLIGQIIFFFGGPMLRDKGLPSNPLALHERWYFGLHKSIALTVAVAVFIPIAAFLMANPKYVQNLAVLIALPILVYLLWEIKRSTREEGARMFVILVLVCFSMLFWSFFELAGSALNLFADAHVERTVPYFGELKASLLTASINPFFIILLGIPFAKLWVWLAKKQAEPSSPLKFALGLLQLAAGFLVLYVGAVKAGPGGRCSVLFLALGFFLHTTGELCLSPVGLSTITKLSPARMVGTFMGVWFLASALGNVLGGWVGGTTEHAGFSAVFFWITATAAAAAVLLALFVRPLKRMMHGVK